VDEASRQPQGGRARRRRRRSVAAQAGEARALVGVVPAVAVEQPLREVERACRERLLRGGGLGRRQVLVGELGQDPAQVVRVQRPDPVHAVQDAAVLVQHEKTGLDEVRRRELEVLRQRPRGGQLQRDVAPFQQRDDVGIGERAGHHLPVDERPQGQVDARRRRHVPEHELARLARRGEPVLRRRRRVDRVPDPPVGVVPDVEVLDVVAPLHRDRVKPVHGLGAARPRPVPVAVSVPGESERGRNARKEHGQPNPHRRAILGAPCVPRVGSWDP